MKTSTKILIALVAAVVVYFLFFRKTTAVAAPKAAAVSNGTDPNKPSYLAAIELIQNGTASASDFMLDLDGNTFYRDANGKKIIVSTKPLK